MTETKVLAKDKESAFSQPAKVRGLALVTIAKELNCIPPNCQSQLDKKKQLILELKKRPIVNLFEWVKAFNIGLRPGNNPELKDHQRVIFQRFLETEFTNSDLFLIKKKIGHLNCINQIFETKEGSYSS
jgi:hypothetical protein